MAEVLKTRRLANAGRRRRRNMTAKQIRYFGTKRQKAGLRNRGFKRRIKRARKLGSSTARQTTYYLKSSLARRRKRYGNQGIVSQAEHAAERAIRSVEQAAEDAIGAVTRQVNGRRTNVGEILTVLPANPGRRRRKRVARARARNRGRVRSHNRRRTHNRRRHNVRHHRRHNRRHNAPRVVVRYRNRRHHRRHNRRRNQGIGGGLGGDIGKVLGVLGGAIVTGIVTGFLPSTWTTGTMGYVVTAVAAIALGQISGRVLKNRSLGTFVTVGGLLLVALPLISQLFPTLALPFSTGTHGLGLITSSNFFVPQVNLPGSMASFVTPAGIPTVAALPATSSTLRGLGQGASPLIGLRSARRMGRLR